MFLSRNKKNNVYPCKPQFYYIKVGFKGSELYRHVFLMSRRIQDFLTVNVKVKATGQFVRSICPASILYKSIAGRYRPVRIADGPITARYRFIKNPYWVHFTIQLTKALRVLTGSIV